MPGNARRIQIMSFSSVKHVDYFGDKRMLAQAWAHTFTDLVLSYSALNLQHSSTGYDWPCLNGWFKKKKTPKYVDTKANSHIKSVEPHTLFSIHLPPIQTVLYIDPCMVSLQNPSEQHKFL